MRDNHDGMPEILGAYERNGAFFGVVRVVLDNAPLAYEFGVEQRGYTALKRILQSRPFDDAPGVICRYFFAGSYSRRVIGQEPVTIDIRVEQNQRGKTFEFDCPTSLASNLRWFIELRDPAQASGLKLVSSTSR